MKRKTLLIPSLLICLLASETGLTAPTTPAPSPPKVSLAITASQGSAGADSNLTGFYKGMPWLPCTLTNEAFGRAEANKKLPKPDTLPNDLLQFDLTVTNEDANADGVMDDDLYVFLFNPNASGKTDDFEDMSQIASQAQVWAVQEAYFVDNPAPMLLPFAQLKNIDPARAVFKTAENFTSTSFKTTLLSGPMAFDNGDASGNLPQGPWMIVAMLVNAKKLPHNKITINQLQNPQYWQAWDAKPFFLGTPFPIPVQGTGLKNGNGKCN